MAGQTGNDPLGEAALRAAALRYLARYAATGDQVARVLHRRALRYGDGDPATVQAVAERAARIVADLGRIGLLDDAGYAAMKAGSLFRRGASTRQITATLREKGVPDALVSQAIAALDAEHGENRERQAALRYARRRGLGPWSRLRGQSGQRDQRRLREIAALVRAGYPPPLAIWTVDLDRGDAEALLSEGAATDR